MSTDTDNVIAFPGVRVAAEPATLIIGAVLEEEPQVVHRQFGINDRLTLRELSEALRIMFGWPGESAPTKFTLDGTSGLGEGAGVRGMNGRGVSGAGFDAGMTVNVPLDTVIGDVLQDVGDTLTWHWGLWDHRLDVREAFARDEATPNALCIGGSGTIDGLWRGGRQAHAAEGRGSGGDAVGSDGSGGSAREDARGGSGRARSDSERRAAARSDEAPRADADDEDAADGPDIAAINELLTGEQSIRNTLANARDDVVDLIERSGVFEFVPLLQALDLRRNPGCNCVADECDRMRDLPAEDPDDAAGRDAALATLLCLAALTDEDIRHDVTSHVMDVLGWVADDGTPLTGEDVEDLCGATWAVLEEVGVVGEEQVGVVEKLDLLREALRR
ncbi:hypothetical protein ACFORJ_04395 [Corynebacterium hansenii]|uniref:Uncharacterized protein n=1 Tax=Corynebacterium hansenii TaxID=394964 RepID=A0ABV7ZLG5_9CORY|nr:hypothetical protein [Corynebacterium hansenii]WJY98766.1 hypothetical protein CHAN_00610 [Corynebacterium hansenii]